MQHGQLSITSRAQALQSSLARQIAREVAPDPTPVGIQGYPSRLRRFHPPSRAPHLATAYSFELLSSFRSWSFHLLGPAHPSTRVGPASEPSAPVVLLRTRVAFLVRVGSGPWPDTVRSPILTPVPSVGHDDTLCRDTYTSMAGIP